MQFFTLACLAGCATAGSVETPAHVYQRNIATVTNVLNTVSTGLANLDNAVKAFSGSNIQTLNDQSASLISALRVGRVEIDNSTPLDLSESITLQQAVGGLQTQGQNLLNDLRAKKTLIEQANYCGITRQHIIEINTSSQALIDAIVRKVPAAAQAIAKNMAGGLTQVLVQSQNDFLEANCKNSGTSTPCTSATSTTTMTTSVTLSSSTSTISTSTSTVSPVTLVAGSSVVTGTVTVSITTTICPLTMSSTATAQLVNATPSSSTTLYAQASTPVLGAAVPSASAYLGNNTISTPITAGAAFAAPAGALALVMAVAALAL